VVEADLALLTASFSPLFQDVTNHTSPWYLLQSQAIPQQDLRCDILCTGCQLNFEFAFQMFSISQNLHLTYLHTNLDRDAPRTDVRLPAEAEILPGTGSNPASCPVIPGALLHSSIAVKKGGSYSPFLHNFPSSCVRTRKLSLQRLRGGETLRCVTSVSQSRMACLSDVPCNLPGVMENSHEKHPSGNQFPDRDLKAGTP